jgi:hypothetical protein
LDEEEAEVSLGEARAAFLERGIAFDAALVSLDLAMVHARRGDTGEVQRLAAEMLPIFESRDVRSEAFAASCAAPLRPSESAWTSWNTSPASFAARNALTTRDLALGLPQSVSTSRQ